jgi:anti-sigma factor RsiW
MESNAIELVCREVVELVTEYLGGTLAAKDRERFDQHLATCPPCTTYLAEVKTTLELAAELGSASTTADDDVPKQLGDLFRRWHDQKHEP